MKAQYLVLTDLKRTDEKIFRLKNELDQIPLDLKNLDEEIEKSLQVFQVVKGQHDDLEKSVRKAESDLKEKEDFLRKAESKMMEVKTNEEYQAALKENETHKTEKGSLEEKVLTLITELEGFKSKLKEAETAHKERTAEFTGQKNRLQEEGKSIQKSYEELLEKRKSIVSQLSSDIKSLYEKAYNTIKGVVIAKVDKGMCCSCHVRVRPQLYNEVLGFKAFHRCPSCSRILIADIDLTESEA
jgi:predicted  nucleic acid-binding Zn-ribbon protein